MRLFFALRPPADIGDSLAELAVRLSADYGGRATHPETIHLTLAFLGEQPAEQAAVLSAAASRIVAPPFELTLDHVGHWPHNHLLWAGCRRGSPTHEAIRSLTHALFLEMRACGLASDRDESAAFTPHITLVRKVGDLAHCAPLPAMPPLVWLCSEFVLVHSHLTPQGPVHESIATFPLRVA